MDYNSLLKFVVGRFGHGYNNAAYYTQIGVWLDWYKGLVHDFHTTITSNGITVPKRVIYRLQLAKRVSEDWASAVCADKPQIVVSGARANSSIFVQGNKNNSGVLGSNNFNTILSRGLEWMFALGTSAIVLDLEGIGVDAVGNIVDASRGRIGLSLYEATRVVPISFKNGNITECAFITQHEHKGVPYFSVSCHIKEEDGYVIYSYVLNNRGNLSSLTFGLLPIIRTKMQRPLFTIFTPNIANNVDLDSPMGLSVYANAIDNLKGTDQVFDACIRDVTTGQRIVLMNKCLLTVGSDGKPIVPQDAKQSYFQFFGDEASAGVGEFIKEFTPKLNSTELDKELQNQLNMLSFKCGLGVHYYNFDRSGGLTATEYNGERQDFVRNVQKMNLSVGDSIREIVKTILTIGAEVFHNGVDSNAKVTVVMSDGIKNDPDKEREQDRQDVKDNIMSRAEYRAKWYGETLEEAQAKLPVIAPVAVI